MQNNLDGRFWISKSDHSFLGKGRIELLMHIEKSGSITRAAKLMKMSYKAAWDAVEHMNNLSDHPLVERSKGGKGGGGTHLTDYAKELIVTYKILNEEHQRFLKSLSLRIDDKNGHFNLLESMSIKISARNQLKAKVFGIKRGAVESELFLRLNSNDTITAVLTNDSVDSLNIDEGTQVYALFKANAVIISSDIELTNSDRNRFLGKVSRISRGSFNAEVVVELNGGDTICSTMSIESLDELKLQNGMKVVTFCKPKSIMLAIC